MTTRSKEMLGGAVQLYVSSEDNEGKKPRCQGFPELVPKLAA